MKRFVAVILVSAMWLSGCAQPDPGRQFTTLFALQKNIAQALEQESGGTRWHIEPVTGVVPHVGDVFNGVAPATSCDFGPTTERDYSGLPAVTQTDRAEVYAGVPLPNDWLETLRLEGGFKGGQKLELKYTGLKAKFIPDVPLRDHAPACLDQIGALGSEEVRVVRGVITGRMNATYGQDFSPTVQATVLEKEALKLSFVRERGFKLEDTEDRVQFRIVAFIKVEFLQQSPIVSAGTEEDRGELIRKALQDPLGVFYSHDSSTIKNLAKVAVMNQKEAEARHQAQERWNQYKDFITVVRDGEVWVYGVEVR